MIRALVLLALLALPASALASEWRYTDGAGTEVVLSEPPQRIVAHASVAAALIPLGIEPVGILLNGQPSLERALEGVDVSHIPVVSQGWGEIDAEAILALAPDIIITEYAPEYYSYAGGTHEEPFKSRLEAIAPLIGIATPNSTLATIVEYEGFARSLTDSVNEERLAADKAAFEKARDALIATAASKSDLTVLPISPGRSEIALGVASRFGELVDFRNWGVNIVELVPTSGDYHATSWENIRNYDSDILLIDDRWGIASLATITEHPLGARIPAIIARQTGNWPAGWIRSYRVYAQEIDRLTGLLERSEKL
ncbi:ABC transporter substrate-binding protein [Devosia sp. MC532]|uniref:ABC transporter substrate-binding protein n=1 Tax=Devosia sp. MC532 TaxID=2799788 RepID=UPI0018F64F05|nr:ABC transporter substrate-binding protein [Devosia sp. MC532]MBJ7578812.1 ABC transporter substrate-binding protein [Devosia sp. MC532]